MVRKLPFVGLTVLFLLLLATVPALAAAPQPEQADLSLSDPVTVSAGERVYTYEGMVVYNNGGTVYATLSTVYNNGGTVYQNGGTVYNNGGKVYAAAGVVYQNSGTVYQNHASVYAHEEDDTADSHIYGYYELRLADYYEPYVTIEGVTTEPGSEMMIISEDSVCRVTPREGYKISSAKADAGKIIREKDGSVCLVDVDKDTTLKLKIVEISGK